MNNKEIMALINAQGEKLLQEIKGVSQEIKGVKVEFREMNERFSQIQDNVLRLGGQAHTQEQTQHTFDTWRKRVNERLAKLERGEEDK